MLKIRLMRIGTKKRPFYRIVAVDERKKRTGGYLALLGTYNPLTNPKEINIVQDQLDQWVKKGAQLSHGMLRILKKAPQKPPRKPKKEKVAKVAPSAPTSPQEEVKTAEVSPQAGEEQAVPVENLEPSEGENVADTPKEVVSEEPKEE